MRGFFVEKLQEFMLDFTTSYVYYSRKEERAG
jgi:hypothetical protein